MGSSEEITGRLVRDFGLDRDEIVVATKVHFDMRPGKPNGGGSSRKNIMAEIDHSLKRLNMDYVDLYQIHRLDANTPMEEIMEALHDVVKSGKARYIGASTIFAWQLERMQQIAERNGWTKFVSALPRPQDGRRSVESARRRPLRPSVGNEDRAQRDRRSVADGMGCDGRARQSGCGQP